MHIEKLFEIVKDGKWHQIDELVNQLQISTEKLIELSQLFEDRGILIYDKNANRIKIDPKWKSLLPIEEASL